MNGAWPCLLTAAVGVSFAQPAPVSFVDVSEAAGVTFVHDHGGSGERYMVETMGAGLALVDLDGDGYLDLYFAQGAATPGSPARPLRNGHLRGDARGAFDAAPRAGTGSERYSMGVAAADFDDDGLVDLYVTNFGANQLYRNNGDGTFAEIGAEARVDDPSWGVSAAWGDIDGDGDLDLYVVNYVDFAWDNHKFCGSPQRGLRAYCHPDVYGAVADVLYRNLGDGTFEEIGVAAGIADARDGKGLGVSFADYDDDGDADIYVANDSTRNFLYTNAGDGQFIDDGLISGTAFNGDGQAEAGMGVDWGDYDGDGRLDVIVTNLDLETNTLYRNLGGGDFADASFAAGIGEPSLLEVGFGVQWLDVDNDGDADLFVANGHIIDNIAEFRDNLAYAQRNHLFLNDGHGTLFERGAAMGPGMQRVRVSRGSAAGDIDGDGDLDIAVSNNGQRADLLRNDGGDTAGNWLQLRLVGRTANRTAAGARVTVQRGSGGRDQVRELSAGNSYASSSDPTLHFGLGSARAADVGIRWPGGEVQELRGLAAGNLYVVQQGRGVIAARPPRRPARPA